MRRFLSVITSILLLTLVVAAIGLHTRPPMGQWFETGTRNAAALPESGPIEIIWLGTSTVLISDGQHHLLSDGFFSRPSLLTLATGPIEPSRTRIEAALDNYQIDKLDAVLVLHTHYDHAMDAPLVAQLTDAVVIGSESTANVARGLPLPEQQIQVASAGQPITIGTFTVTFLESDHVPQSEWIDKATGMNEVVSEPLATPAWIHEWKEGESWTVLIEHAAGTILLQGSAGFREGQLTGYEADLALLSSVGLFRQSDEFQQAYFRNTASATDADTVIPIHWDDFFAPLEGQSTPPLPWLIEHLNASFSALQQAALQEDRAFVVVRPGERFYFGNGDADQAAEAVDSN